MAKAKAKDEEVKVKPQETVTVNEAPPADLVIKNPYITAVVKIDGLAEYRRQGVRASTMKTLRGWIRARGSGPSGNLSVTFDGVVLREVPEGGDDFTVEGEAVKTDLIEYTISHEVLQKYEITITPPATRRVPTVKKDEPTPDAPTPDVTADADAEDAQPKDW